VRDRCAPNTAALALTPRELAIIKAIVASLGEQSDAGAESSRGRLACNKAEAARALGVSVDFFDEHIAPELRVVRRGRRRLISVKELERWLQESAARALDAS
jgi:excisionase family DNA binding protein